jgi:hypothetical protein
MQNQVDVLRAEIQRLNEALQRERELRQKEREHLLQRPELEVKRDGEGEIAFSSLFGIADGVHVFSFSCCQ